MSENHESCKAEGKEAVGKVVAVIQNNHAASCGEPPNYNSNDFEYFSVFQNNYGEQMVFMREKQEDGLGECHVRLGDNQWTNMSTVVDGKAVGLIVNGPEAMFIKACWDAATHFDHLRREDKRKKEANQP
ncbi:hypothetical protein LCGC14_0920510 [marine sediment metagenome]|uniref:Uncharacterized protein n=1 Tax=marine sediment metagenome TaxID=412755 RepID=A0A0F9R9Q8_9ZZZZ